jgi:hypothetical protein
MKAAGRCLGGITPTRWPLIAKPKKLRHNDTESYAKYERHSRPTYNLARSRFWIGCI